MVIFASSDVKLAAWDGRRPEGRARLHERLALAVVVTLTAGCVTSPAMIDPAVAAPHPASAKIVEVANNANEWRGRSLTVSGDIVETFGQVDIWTTSVNAVHLWGDERALNCLQLRGALADSARFRENSGYFRVTGRVFIDPSPKKPLGCPGDVGLAVERIEPAP